MNLQHTPFLQKQFSGTNVHGNLSIYTVIKATYDFNNKGALKIADEQEKIITHDQFYDHPKNSSICYSEESMPFKKASEVLFVGSIQPRPNHSRQQTILIKLKYADTEWQKSLTVFGKRYWYSSLTGAKISEPLVLSDSLELRYELAFGGNDYPANPVGRGFTEKRFNVNDIELPQIEYTQALIRSPRSRPYVAGFNGIPKHWQPRLQADHHSLNRHNLAPLDQQFSTMFQGGEVLYIAGWMPQPILLSIPKIVNDLDKPLEWDTISVDVDSQKLYLLTRMINL